MGWELIKLTILFIKSKHCLTSAKQFISISGACSLQNVHNKSKDFVKYENKIRKSQKDKKTNKQNK